MATAAEPTEVDEMVYGYQINKGLEAWAEKKYEFSKHEVQVKKKYNITETRDWWPKRKVLAVYESWVEKKTKNVSIALMECQQTSQSIQQLKRDVAEFKKKLEACESRDRLAISPRGWPGPPGGRDQQGAVGGMYPDLSAPPPDYEMGTAPSDGHVGESHTSMFPSREDSYPGTHMPLASTPHHATYQPMPLMQSPTNPPHPHLLPMPLPFSSQQDQHQPPSNGAASASAPPHTDDSVVRDESDMVLTRGADGPHGAASRRQADNRNWVDNYTETAQPLNDMLKGKPDSRDKISLGTEARQAFEDLKNCLCEAPALGLPNVQRPFTLFVNECRGFMTSALTQEHGGLWRPVGYYSAKLDTTALGFGPCLRAVQAVYLANQLVTNLVLDQKITIRCPHSVNALLAGRKVPCVSDSRWGNWQAVLEAPNISLQKASVSNLSTMIAPTDATNEEDDHVCEDLIALMDQEHFVKEDPLHNPELVLYTDGSSLVEDGIRGAGWAVTTEHEVLETGSMDPGTSAQQAELKALTQALKLAEGKSATVYCDSRYALGVVMDFGRLWAQRGFVTAKGTPIKNGQLVADLLDAMLLPKELAVVKVKAHTHLDTPEARGNALADDASRKAARQKEGRRNGNIEMKTDLGMENDYAKCLRLRKESENEEWRKESLASIMEMQNASSQEEKWDWMGNSAKLHDDKVWRQGTKTVAPQNLLPYLATQLHSLGHVGVEKMRNRFSQVWWNPKFTGVAKDVVKRCVTCMKNNHDRKVKLPMLKVPAPPGPFRCLQVDYITLPACKGYRDVLVVIDKFSRWIEAYPARRGTAAHTAKVLVKDFIPRYGLPDQICSDNGSHFTGAVCAEVCRMLNIEWSFHCPYHPQSSGQVERANRTLKERLAKMHQEGTPWVDALPIALSSMRATHNKDVGLSPYEVVFGRFFSFPGSIDLRKADVHLTSDALMNYCIKLSETLQLTSNQVKEAWVEPPEGGHSLVPGQWVMIHKPQRIPLEAKYEGPYQILLVTPSAIRVANKTKWIHASHCKLVDAPTD